VRLSSDNRVSVLLHGLGALLFALSALLQYNDPDPVVWIAIYAAAAAACLATWRDPTRIWFPGAVGIAAMLWAVSLLIRTLRESRLGNPFGSMMKGDDPVELTREILGLLIIATWMTLLVVRGRARAKGI
jgi:hypothetical protein